MPFNFNKILEIIENKGIKKKDFVNKIGISTQAFYDIQKRNSIKTDLLEKIANELGVPVSYFFDEDSAGGVMISNGSGNVAVGNSKIIIKEQKKEIEHLRREVELLRELLQQKDEMIRMLKKMKG